MTPTLPDWPPEPGEKIGVERARAYIAWIRVHAPPALEEARAMLRDRYPDAATSTSAVTVEQLAGWSLDPRMTGLAIGTVFCSIGGGTWAQVDISITRDGRLVATPGWNMRER